jgi:hypothetical protein
MNELIEQILTEIDTNHREIVKHQSEIQEIEAFLTRAAIYREIGIKLGEDIGEKKIRLYSLREDIKKFDEFNNKLDILKMKLISDPSYMDEFVAKIRVYIG